MSSNIPSARIRDLAQQLIAHEVSRQTPPARTSDAIAHVFDELRRPLCTLAGVSGIRVLLGRALMIASRQVDGLHAVTVEADACVTGLNQLRNGTDAEGGVAFLAQLLALLGTFIGESLTMNILFETWPDIAALNTQAAGEENKQ